MSQVRVEIDGHAYRMSCDAGEEARVEGLAADLDGTIRALKSRIGEIGDRRIAIMAALTILDRLKTAEGTIADLSERATRLERARERSVIATEADNEPLIARIDAATAAIERLTQDINAQVRATHRDGRPRVLADTPDGTAPATLGRAPRAAADTAAAAPAPPQSADETAPQVGGLDAVVPSFTQRR